jgi:hypothetical protein
LTWHGALHLEYFCDDATGQPRYIEANPRIGETMNATLSGVDLCDLLVQVSLDKPRQPPVFSRPGVRSHSVVTGIMGAAQRGEGRRGVLGELWRCLIGRDVYHNSQDELTRGREDPLSLLPAIVVAGQLLASPPSATRIINRAVENYGLTDAAARRIRAVRADALPLA